MLDFFVFSCKNGIPIFQGMPLLLFDCIARFSYGLHTRMHIHKESYQTVRRSKQYAEMPFLLLEYHIERHAISSSSSSPSEKNNCASGNQCCENNCSYIRICVISRFRSIRNTSICHNTLNDSIICLDFKLVWFCINQISGRCLILSVVVDTGLKLEPYLTLTIGSSFENTILVFIKYFNLTKRNQCACTYIFLCDIHIYVLMLVDKILVFFSQLFDLSFDI